MRNAPLKYWQTLEALLASQSQWVLNHVVQPDRIAPAIAGVGLNMERLTADMHAVEVKQRIAQLGTPESQRYAGIFRQWPATAQFWPAAIGGSGPRRVKKVASCQLIETWREAMKHE